MVRLLIGGLGFGFCDIECLVSDKSYAKAFGNDASLMANAMEHAMDECDFAIFADRLGLYATTSLKAGEILFREGDEADALYIVSRGTLTVMSGSAVLEVVQGGGIIGEMALVDTDEPRSASVIAATHVELFRIDKSDFLALVAGAPNFAVMVMRVMARRLRIMNQRYRPQAARW